jgi:virginiamycin B lyase
LSTPDAKPGTLTLGPDGNIWFTELHGQRIGKITPAGAITEYKLPMKAVPFSIAPGADGNLWITVIRGRDGSQTRAILKLSPEGEMIAFEPPAGAVPGFITAGPDGNLWFTQPRNPRIARLTPAGELTTFDALRRD